MTRRWLIGHALSALGAATGLSTPALARPNAGCDDPAAAVRAAAKLTTLLADAAGAAGNVLLSPASLQSVLLALWLGAAGAARRELGEALGLGAACRSDSGDTPVLSVLRPLKSATAVWTAQTTALMPGYTKAVQRVLSASVQPFPARSSAANVQAVNRWVAGATHGRIPQLLDAIDPAVRVLIVNAVLLESRWAEPFAPQDTQAVKFRLDDGSRVDVPFMSRRGSLTLQRMPAFTRARLALADRRLAVDLLLPAEGRAAGSLLSTLMEPMQSSSPQDRAQVRLRMPRLALYAHLALTPALRTAGLGIMLDPQRADFTPMLGQQGSAVVDLRQAVRLVVDEAGIEAAAATASTLVGSLPQPPNNVDLVLDRPFLLAVRDLQDEMPLFAGIVRDPRGER